MFFIGRPLTLLAIAVCTYITITWKFRPTGTIPSVRTIYNENGFVRYEATRSKSAPAASAASDQTDSLQQQHFALDTATTPDASPKLYGPEKSSSTSPLLSVPAEQAIQHNEYMKDMLDWSRPEHRNGHWPAYEDYVDADYDPNRWEGFKLYVSCYLYPERCADQDQ